MKSKRYRPMSFKRLLMAVSACIAALAVLLIALSYVPKALAGDATSFDPTAVAVEAKGASDTPIGSVLAWSHNTIPDGWLECNGQSTSGYPELTAIVGATVPDLRGEFIRGWDHGKGTDAGRTLKSSQAHAMQSHSHAFSGSGGFYIGEPSGGGWSTTGAALDAELGHSYWGRTDNGVNVNVSISGTTSPAGSGTETRPRNIAMMYIIKAQ